MPFCLGEFTSAVGVAGKHYEEKHDEKEGESGLGVDRAVMHTLESFEEMGI